jgi:hypothetical protein
MDDDELELECSIGIDDPSISIPRGGPIYVSNMSGPIVRVPLFQDSLLSQLHSLQSQLPPDSNHDHDISVDDLKVFTEDQLMDMALKQQQVFQGERDNNQNQPPNAAAAELVTSITLFFHYYYYYLL